MTAFTESSPQTATSGWPFQRHWVIRARHVGNQDLFVAGEFNRWRLPGMPMKRRDGDVWEARVPLTTATARRFACFVLDACSIRGIPNAHTECFVDRPDSSKGGTAMTTEVHFKELHHPSHEEIARRAYAIYLAEGRPNGRALNHWLRAEKELRLPAEPPALPSPKARVRPSGRVALATH